MKEAPKPDLSAQEAGEIIAEITKSDRDRARVAIGAGVQAAQAQWIEGRLIAEALALELIAVAEHSLAGDSMAVYLRALADALEARAGYH